MYEHLLVPTDGSEGTQQAIAHGLRLADRFDATVHGLSVVPEGPLGASGGDGVVTTARRAVDHVEDEATATGLEAVTTVEHGVPHEVILEYCSDEGIDMVVMGTKGRTGLDRVLVGSVTERVVRMADVPVVTVRLSDEPRH